MKKWLIPAEAAAYLDISLQTLNRVKREGRGPKHQNVGKRVIYQPCELDKWKTQNPSNNRGKHRRDFIELWKKSFSEMSSDDIQQGLKQIATKHFHTTPSKATFLMGVADLLAERFKTND